MITEVRPSSGIRMLPSHQSSSVVVLSSDWLLPLLILFASIAALKNDIQKLVFIVFDRNDQAVCVSQLKLTLFLFFYREKSFGITALFQDGINPKKHKDIMTTFKMKLKYWVFNPNWVTRRLRHLSQNPHRGALCLRS